MLLVHYQGGLLGVAFVKDRKQQSARSSSKDLEFFRTKSNALLRNLVAVQCLGTIGGSEC